MFDAWESRRFDFADVSTQCRVNAFLAGHEVLYEFRYAASDGQAQHVVQDQNLAVGAIAGANADHGDFHRLGNFFGQLARYTFEQQHGRAGLFQRNRVGAHLPRLVFVTALDLVATEDVHRLRGQTHVCAYRDAALGEQADRVRQPQCTFDFDHVRASLH
ncbi:hypothetical protein D3C87_1680670 [compost metagenome]